MLMIVVSAGPSTVLTEVISEATELREKAGNANIFSSGSTSGTMVPGDQGTLVSLEGAGTFVNHDTADCGDGTMINYSTGGGTMLQHNTPGTAISRTMSEIESNLGTMVINESEQSTMKQYGTAPGQAYTPEFLQHFQEKEKGGGSGGGGGGGGGGSSEATPALPEVVAQEPGPATLDGERAGRELHQRMLQQIAGGVSPSHTGLSPSDKLQRSITDGDLEFLKFLSYEDLTTRSWSRVSSLGSLHSYCLQDGRPRLGDGEGD